MDKKNKISLAKEVAEKTQKRTMEILKKLKEKYPGAKIALRFSNNWELLVAVILSAHCADKKVNPVTKIWTV